jgi:hypothetical protein
MKDTRTTAARWGALLFLVSLMGACGESGTAEPRLRNLVYCENPEVDAPACSLGGYSATDDSALRAKLGACATAGCHGTGASTFSINLAVPTVADALAPLTSTRATSGDLLVDEFDPDCSDMLTKVTGQPASGLQMPIGGPFWTSAETDCFRAYLHDFSN